MPVDLDLYKQLQVATLSRDEGSVYKRGQQSGHLARWKTDEGIYLLVDAFLRLAIRDAQPWFADDIPNPFFMATSYTEEQILQALPAEWHTVLRSQEIPERLVDVWNDPRFTSSGDEWLFILHHGEPTTYSMDADNLHLYIDAGTGLIRPVVRR